MFRSCAPKACRSAESWTFPLLFLTALCLRYGSGRWMVMVTVVVSTNGSAVMTLVRFGEVRRQWLEQSIEPPTQQLSHPDSE
jgi:hypothetical protein